MIFEIIVRLNPSKIVIKAINGNDYKKANTIYDKRIKGNNMQEEALGEGLESELDKLVDEFTNNKISYDDARNKIEALAEFNIITKKVENSRKEIDDLHVSRVAFNDAIKYEANDNYIDAITEYNAVIEKDSDNYAKA